MKEFELYKVYLFDSQYDDLLDPEEMYDGGSPTHIMSIFVTDSGGEYITAENGKFSSLCDELYNSRVVSMRKSVDSGIENWEKVLLSNLGQVEVRWDADPLDDYATQMDYEITDLNLSEIRRKEFDDSLDKFYRKYNIYGLYQPKEEGK